MNMFVSETHIRVRYAETDQMKVVYHGNYAQYFETARAESIRNLGYTYKDMEDMGVIMPIVELHVKFIRPAEYDDLLTVKTMLQELPEGHRIEFRHEVYNQQGKLLTWGKVVLYFLDAKTMEKVAMPEPLRKKLETHFHTAGKKGQKI